VQSRVAMLDIFLMFWVVAAFGALVIDRDDGRARLASRLGPEVAYPGPKLGVRKWRVVAALCLGAACGTKWSALFFVFAFAALAFAWDVGARRTAGVPAPFRAALWREGPGVLLLFVGLVVAVYVSTWAGWFLTAGGWRRSCDAVNPPWHNGPCGPISGFWEYHQQIYSFHRNLDSGHTYKSNPFGWLLLARPVSYFYETPRPKTSQEILGIGTPLIWWAALPAMGATAWRWFSRRDWRAGAILVAFGAGYLPWLYYAGSGRTMFLFYALPMVPFMCLALALCAGWAIGPATASRTRRSVGGIALGGYLLAVLINFAYFVPIWTARVLPYDSWRDRIWFGSWI
jgi:dolichyl-phosphate-mannose-protein mannosyltransferase